MITSQIRELLYKADINRKALNNVPLDSVDQLVELRLVEEQWRDCGGVRGASADAPTHVDGVKLTPAGVQLACSIQGLDKVKMS